MSNSIALTIESLVAVLLAVTILYCWILNRRLMRLRADESALKAMIAELVVSTDIAERAIAGLKKAVADNDELLGEKLARADSLTHSLSAQLDQGEEVLQRLTMIASAARPARVADEPVQVAAVPARPAPVQIAPAPVSMAQAFLARARERRAEAAA
jgi:hypothetical protein